MNRSLQVVAIDGPRGAGKSRLATGLRSYFGCGILELGPIFRLLAWLVKRGDASDLSDACDVLDNALKNCRICIRPDVGGEIAANSIEVNGKSVEPELWNTELDELLRSAAGSPQVVSFIAQLAHRLAGSQPMAVIGREVGREFFPDAPLKIVLLASAVARRERKLSQLKQCHSRVSPTYSLEQSEPTRTWEFHGEDTITIDTTYLSPEEVLDFVSGQIVSKLGWVPISQGEEAHV